MFIVIDFFLYIISHFTALICALCLVSFVVAIGSNIISKMREPNLFQLSYVVMAISLTIVFYTSMTFFWNKLGSFGSYGGDAFIWMYFKLFSSLHIGMYDFVIYILLMFLF